MLRTFASLIFSLLIVSAASFVVAQDAPEGERRPSEARRDEPDRPRDGDRDRARDNDRPRDSDRPRDNDRPRGERGPENQDQHAAAIREQHQRLERLRNALRNLQAEGAEPERREQLEREVMETERHLDEMMRRMRPFAGPGAEHRPGPGVIPGPGHPSHPEFAPRPDERMERDAREHEERRHAQMQRMEHLHQAANHLRHAGLGDLAERVMERIGELERELDHPPQPVGPPEFGALQDQINDLRRAMHEISEQLQQIRRER